MGLQMTGDVSCTEHLPADAAGHLAFMPDHVGAESVFGGKSRSTGLQTAQQTGSKVMQECNRKRQRLKIKIDGKRSYRYLTFERSF